MKTKFNYYQDPGHGWAAVPVSLLAALDIIDQISSYSYARGNTAYLEEDRDLAIFFNAYRAKYKFDPMLISKHSDKRSPIRSYNSFGRSLAVQHYKMLNAAVNAGYVQFITVGNAQEAAK